MAAYAASRRSSGGESEVATTTTERASPAAPRSSSRNSRTSRPRSPTRASTATSQAVWRASMASRVDLPMPEPANRPSRWPWRQVAKQFSARTPRSSRGPSRARCVASGGAARTRRSGGPAGSGPRPSSGRPSGSSTRPSQPSATGSVPPFGSPLRPWSWNKAAMPGPSPSSEPNGIACARPWRKPTISAGTVMPVARRQRSAGRRRNMPAQPVDIDHETGQSGDRGPPGATARCRAAWHDMRLVRSSRVVHLIETQAP